MVERDLNGQFWDSGRVKINSVHVWRPPDVSPEAIAQANAALQKLADETLVAAAPIVTAFEELFASTLPGIVKTLRVGVTTGVIDATPEQREALGL